LLHVESHEFQKKTLVSPSAVVPHQLNSQAPCFVMPQLVNLNNRSDFGLPEPLCKQHLYSDDPVVEKQHTLNDQPDVLLDERFLIGQPVSLVGLKSLKYNGLSGLVTDDLNASGRIGVLLWTELKPLAFLAVNVVDSMPTMISDLCIECRCSVNLYNSLPCGCPPDAARPGLFRHFGDQLFQTITAD